MVTVLKLKNFFICEEHRKEKKCTPSDTAKAVSLLDFLKVNKMQINYLILN
jgi:hypothetical protein